MDPVSLGYYAAVCAGLGLLAPWMGGMLTRLVIGAIVGLLAAGALPYVQDRLVLSAYAD